MSHHSVIRETSLSAEEQSYRQDKLLLVPELPVCNTFQS